MTHRLSNRRMETVVYVSVWGLILAVYIIEGVQFRAGKGLPLMTLRSFLGAIVNLLPFVLLFLLNNHVLIPRLLMRKRVRNYLIYAAGAVMLTWTWQFIEFHFFKRMLDPVGNHVLPPDGDMPSLIPLPLLIDLSYALLVVGGNVAVAMVFRLYDNVLESENIQRTNAQTELAYLKAQINPHFYMNMLNNIHGLLEFDPAAAQQMVMGMSKLMQYMVYDSTRELSPLSSEVDFLRNYIDLMSKRYPADKVEIRASFPSARQMAGVEVPPLLFLVFVENAFKHGVSYRRKSVIDVSMCVTDKTVQFSCTNPIATDKPMPRSGIGLANLSQRLKLLYGPGVVPRVSDAGGLYNITLTLPLSHDLTHFNH